MTKALRTVTFDQHADIALAVMFLKQARDRAKSGGAVHTLAIIRRAIKSAEGAERHAQSVRQAQYAALAKIRDTAAGQPILSRTLVTHDENGISFRSPFYRGNLIDVIV